MATEAPSNPLAIGPLHRGKVRELYRLSEDELLIVTSDRISAFDVVFPTPIPGKGRVLNRLSAFWFRRLAAMVPNHFVAVPDAQWLRAHGMDPDGFAERCMIVRACKPLPVECIVRGSMEGSAWKEYRETGTVAGHALPPGLQLHDDLPAPLFTPTTKATAGHDACIDFGTMKAMVGAPLAEEVARTSIAIFREARRALAAKGIALADTKFEFGLRDGRLHLIDEALTPDSSRFLVRDAGGAVRSMDKQYVRDWCERSGWDKRPPAPALPEDVVRATATLYEDIFRRIVGGSGDGS